MFIAALAFAGVANAQVSEKPASELFSRTMKKQIDAGAIRKSTQVRTLNELPSEKPMPEKALEAKLKHEQKFGVSTASENEKRRKLPSNTLTANDLRKSRRPPTPQPPAH